MNAAYRLGELAACRTFKVAEFNWGLTANPTKKDRIQTDNGRRQYGVNFSEPGRPTRQVSQAFDSLKSQKPSDFLNDMGQGMIGATG